MSKPSQNQDLSPKNSSSLSCTAEDLNTTGLYWGTCAAASNCAPQWHSFHNKLIINLQNRVSFSRHCSIALATDIVVGRVCFKRAVLLPQQPYETTSLMSPGKGA